MMYAYLLTLSLFCNYELYYYQDDYRNALSAGVEVEYSNDTAGTFCYYHFFRTGYSFIVNDDDIIRAAYQPTLCIKGAGYSNHDLFAGIPLGAYSSNSLSDEHGGAGYGIYTGINFDYRLSEHMSLNAGYEVRMNVSHGEYAGQNVSGGLKFTF